MPERLEKNFQGKKSLKRNTTAASTAITNDIIITSSLVESFTVH